MPTKKKTKAELKKKAMLKQLKVAKKEYLRLDKTEKLSAILTDKAYDKCERLRRRLYDLGLDDKT